ncbi:MAG TPA: LPS-assembly protein LptD [Thioalkalivibrio sp.]|nr:LPS-assembly protein LptD [Thioalkalivibrio sp.]
MNVPFLYTPWISFPITDERKSGFLAPAIGNSDKRGFELETPYYWNIAPNYDATFTPRYMSDRGLQLNGEFRYLMPVNRGDLQLSWLDDDAYEDQRWLGRWRNTLRPSTHSRVDIDLNGVSDKRYFDDLSTSLDVISATHLDRRMDARWWFDQGEVLLRLQGYQTVNETLLSTQYPYRRVPQLLFTGGIPDGALGLDYGLRAEWVQFDHDDLVNGSRLDLKPSIALPVRTPGSFLEPRLSGRYTAYRLDDSLPADQREPDRLVPTFSLDSGLIFEREASDRAIQTLEPRLFYVYTPYRDQDDLPVFDTGDLTFTFDQLFREDRFSGPDRVGDANQLSLALTSRLVDTASGRERLRASLGQIFYFEDREVTLPDQPAETRTESDLAAELGAQLGNFWKIDSSLLWNPDTEQTARGSTRIQYRRDSRHVFNLGYRYREDDFEQAEISFGWPLSRRWNGVGRWVYALDDNRDLEALGGLEYESCCWKARLVARQYVTDGGTEYNNAIYFQLVLKGLMDVGRNIEDLLEEGILGYELQD